MYVGHVLEKKPIDMQAFDTMAVAKLARRHLESVEGPRNRQILENFIEHAEAEASGDYQALMASCSKKRQEYATHGANFPAPQSYEELEKHYHNLIASNCYLIHFEAEKLAVDEDVVFLEGLVHQLYPGQLVEPIFGIDIGDPEAVYQLTSRASLTFVFDEDGKGAGEHAYSDGPPTRSDFEKVPPNLVPKAFYENPLS
jgi:hypothetical protein